MLNINPEQVGAWLEISIMLLLAFLLGILMHWWVFGKRSNSQQQEDEMEALNFRYDLLLKERDEALLENAQLKNQTQLLKIANPSANTNIISETENIENNGVYNRMAELDEENQSLKKQCKEYEVKLLQAESDIKNWQLKYDESQAAIQSKLSENNNEISATKSDTHNELTHDLNSDLKNEPHASTYKGIAEATLNNNTNKNADPESIVAKAPEIDSQTPSNNNVNIVNDKHGNLLNSIGYSTAKDDLKLINGIGPFIEEKLNNFGIHSFEQLSKLNSENIEVLNELIQFFPGRIERDKWVEQAKSLLM